MSSTRLTINIPRTLGLTKASLRSWTRISAEYTAGLMDISALAALPPPRFVTYEIALPLESTTFRVPRCLRMNLCYEGCRRALQAASVAAALVLVRGDDLGQDQGRGTRRGSSLQQPSARNPVNGIGIWPWHGFWTGSHPIYTPFAWLSRRRCCITILSESRFHNFRPTVYDAALCCVLYVAKHSCRNSRATACALSA